MSEARSTDYSIAPQFIERWSPRAFTGEAIDSATLMSFFEAARWSPSSSNSQPWRFVYAHKGGAGWDDLLGLLVPANQVWAGQASALVMLVSHNETVHRDGRREPAPWHSFDAGAAWMSLALQVHLSGWAAHAMAGFERERAYPVLGIPSGYTAEAMIAIGRRADPMILSEALRAREAPNARKPLQAIVAEGRFTFDAE